MMAGHRCCPLHPPRTHCVVVVVVVDDVDVAVAVAVGAVQSSGSLSLSQDPVSVQDGPPTLCCLWGPPLLALYMPLM
eukprot:gnl/Chilomastix_caulleri/5694.p2 GENE.gnl/Chilomastix_caulleri/5694~~gnl/Chilomastix_caulleri/5694.p2  ORF type:complete len:77 (-),score=25.04 gnl/Chilomastix_caulleri/5694:211-441(-)